jgi:2,4-dienoyl-CoA reductase-like NADH-dependent reductase (Old Yellow Enzyme family)
VLEEVQEIVRCNAYTPFSIGYYLSPEELEASGISMEDTMQLVEGLVSCRPDWLQIATPAYLGGSLRNRSDRRPRARMIADKVKGRTKVIGVGAIVSPVDATGVLADGVDLVGLGRALVTDPEWVQKVLSGESDLICECIPATGADEMLAIPVPMYRRILNQPEWIPVCAVAPGRRCEKHQSVPG